MFSSVQVALLFDLNSFSDTITSEKELEEYVARLKLSSLRLLTEFGAQTEKGSEVVQWSYKYYDSRSFKPDTARKSFQEFNRKSYDDFENDLTDRFYRAFDAIQGDGSAGGKSGAVQNQDLQSSSVSGNKPHCYILNKSFQEVVHDYNWDRPDISSPVKSNRRRTQNKSKLIPENVGPYNAVIVYTNVPKTQNELRIFCGEESDVEGTADNFMDAVLDPTTRRYFQEEKQIRPYFINLANLSDTDDKILYNGIRSGLSKMQGGLFSIKTLVQTTSMSFIQNGANSRTKAEALVDIFPIPPQPVVGAAHSLHSEWWLKGRPGRARKPQPGPALVWEDSQGTSFLKAQLEVLAVQGSSSRAWGNAVVVGVVQLNAVSLVAVAGGMGSLYVCQAPNTAFTTLVQLLAKYQLAMLLRLGCGGLALLCPWAGDIGCLAVVSSSGLAVPPLSSTSQQSDDILAHFATEIVKRCLGAAPAHNKSEPIPSDKRFDPQKTERWFYPERATVDTISKIKKKRAERIERKIMLERLQKKYRPQIPQPLSAGEISSMSVMAPTKALASDMSHTTAAAGMAQGKKPLPIGKKLSISRAQMLMQNSRVVTAQQKFKDQRSEEEERAKASKRRTAQANEQQRKTEALASQTLNAVEDPQDTSQFVTSLIALRDGTETEVDVPDMDLFTTAQTIMNLTLMHVKVAPGTNMESGLRKVLDNGVLQNFKQINEIHSGLSKLRQYKLQSLLNLELLWILGYSSSSKTEDDSSEATNHSAEVREELVEAAIKMLRSIMLHYNPNAMATFLQETITENYCETLGEVLVEIYEELNQPLPENLAILTGNLMSVAPPSNKSNMGSVKSYDSGAVGSYENNPGSGKEMKRSTALQRHPSFKETTKRQIVVPIGPRVGLRRTVSDAQTKPKPVTKQSDKPQVTKKNKADDIKKNEAEDDVRKVRRSLFDMDDVPRPKLQRSQTISGASDLRKSPRKKSRKSTTTPKKKIASSSSQESFKTPLKDTPTSETGWKTPKSKTGSSERVLVPETPHYKIGTNEFNKRRVRKSTGNTIITESPDVKRACKTTPRRLRASLTISRRNSFYSGARSRNWEKGKSQLLVDKIRAKIDRKSLDISAIENVGDASFLFSEIFSASQSDLSQEIENIALPEKKVLNFGLDDENVENEHSGNVSRSMDFSGFSSPSKNTRLASKSSAESESVSTPLKNIRRSLSMASPAKTQLLSMASPAKPHSFLMPSPKRPQSNVLPSPLKGMRSQSLLSFDSPSKNTNLSTSMGSDVFESPSKNTRSSLSSPVKEIIFSPAKNKNVNVLMNNEESKKHSPLKSRQNSLLQNACILSMTPSKRVQFNFVETPSKRGSVTNSPTPKSILKTPGKTPTKSPLRTPKKSPKMTPNKLIRNRVSQSPFKASTKSPLRTILMTTPTKVEFRTPTKSPHSKTPIKSPFRSPSLFFSSTKILRTPSKTPTKEGANMLYLSNIQADEFSDLVPETPNRPNINVTTLGELPMIDREIELSSPVKGSRSRSTASIVLHNTPTKGQQGIQKDLFSLDPVEFPLDSISTINPPGSVLYKANKQDDGDGSTNLPDIAPEDIEFVNSIMFGSNFDPDSGLGITGSSDEDDEMYKQRLNGMLNSLSSPVKGPSGHNTQQVVMGFEQEVSLGLAGNCTTPVKLDSLLNDYMEEIKTPGKDFRLNVPETLDSPEISLDPKIRKYFEKMKGMESVLSKEEEICYSESSIPKAKENKNRKQRSKTENSVEIEGQNDFVIPSTSNSTNDVVYKDAKCVDENSSADEKVQSSAKRKLLIEDGIEKKNVKATKKKRISNENNTFSIENENDNKRKSKRLSNDIVLAESVEKNEDVSNKNIGKVEKYIEKVNLQASMLFSSEDFEKTKGIDVEDEDEIFSKRSRTEKPHKKCIFDSDSENSPSKSDFTESMPLKNVENAIATIHENQENGNGIKEMSTPDRRHKQQKIDVYLSPGHKPSGIETTPTRGAIDSLNGRKRSLTQLDDWKRIKPLRGLKTNTDKSEVEFDEKLSDSNTKSKTEGKRSPKKSKKRKSVKLKLAKTSEGGYKATTNVSLEGSDLNSSTEQSQKENLNDSNSTDNIFTPKPKKRKSVDYDKMSILTPHRFTRGISKDMHVTPADFQKLITLSPVKGADEGKRAKRLSDEFLGAKIEEELSRKTKPSNKSSRRKVLSADFEDLPMPTPSPDKISSATYDLSELPMQKLSTDKSNNRNSQSSDFDGLPMPSPSPDKPGQVVADTPLKGVKDTPLKGMTDIWTATSVPGSPTMTKFIRKERKKNSICKTPRIQLSPVHYSDSVSKLSMQSILHLASSPIIKTKSENSNLNKSKRLSLKSKKQRLSSIELDNISEHPNDNSKDSVAPIKKVYKTYEEKILEEVALIDKKFKTRRRSSTMSVDSEDSIKSIGQPKSPIIKSNRKKSRRSTLCSQEEEISEVFQSPPKSKISRVNSHGSTNEASDEVLRQELPVTPKAYKTYEDRIMDEVKLLSNTPRSTRPSKNLRDISSPEEDESPEKVHKPRRSNVFKTTKRKLERDLPEPVSENIEIDSSHNNPTFKTPKIEPDVDKEHSRLSRNCKTPKGVCYISPASPEEEYYPRQKSRTGRRLSKASSILD